MPKANRNAQCEPHTSDTVLPEEETSFEQESESEQEVSIRQHQTPTSEYIPYVEGPKMNWTVDDSLYNQFIKWKIKCKNILDCKLAMLSEAQRCKKVVSWSGDFGVDQFISWDLTPEETSLGNHFCKPQTNEIRARFNLLTSFRQGDHLVDKWYSANQVQVNLAKY